MNKFKEYKGLDLAKINEEIQALWAEKKTFEQSLEVRRGSPTFIFYEGPPSANGMPGIHHVMARAIKDVFCRYKTQKGFLVERKAGWDTHGLPVELGVEKMLEITKEDIGKKISVEEYNAACRKEVMKYTKEWEMLTNRMGYWVDMQDPYITCDNRYIESLWYLLKEIYKKNLLYKGYTIQPYSPAAGTGLSSHELNQPGCYRDVKDTSCVAMFKCAELDAFFLAWTTTPWTLPSNTALAVGSAITYVLVETANPYTKETVKVILAKEALTRYGLETSPILAAYVGKELAGKKYEQLIPWSCPYLGEIENTAFSVLCGDFVTTEDGTGIVHIAPTFGADDDRVAKANGVPPMLLIDKDGNRQPMVDRTGKFFRIEDLDATFVREKVNVEKYAAFAGRYVKNEYIAPSNSSTGGEPTSETTLDVDICVMLKQQGLAFRIEKFVHSYPHCWRTDKPVLYYPLDSWFIRTTAMKERMMELNDTINWKPESTGTGRFGKWLENLQDWNLSRSRYWGTPLPIWRTEDGSEEICIGSTAELYDEIEKAVAKGFMEKNPLKEKGFILGEKTAENYDKIDLHRPFVDEYTLVSASGKPMKRELDLIDVWFDSGAMPFAQEFVGAGNETPQQFPADFIAEGVDQTRGWFFTLHAIATMVRDSVSFRNVISNGLVLDREGNKMSKRLGNAVEPFKVLNEQGADALRWYMLTNAQPWDNLKFDLSGVDEVKRKFFGTLYNTYSFFALYANVDHYQGNEKEVPITERPEIDRWIISLQHSLIKAVDEAYSDYDVTLAGRLIQDFVCDHLSNWYVRLNRKRFWGGGLTTDKLAAYQTLCSCLETVALLSAPIAPFFMERLFGDLSAVTNRYSVNSVHLALFPNYNENYINRELEEQMTLAQRASSMALALRRKVNIKVRQPLTKIMIPVLDAAMQQQLEAVQQLILNEVNVKEMEFLHDTTGVIVKKIKPNFKTLGKKYGKQMKEIADLVNNFTQQQIAEIETSSEYRLILASGEALLLPEDVEITSEDMPGWLVASEGKLTVALDVTVTEALRREGIARELINRIQNLRKDSGFNVTDRITITLQDGENLLQSVVADTDMLELIKSQTLADSLTLVADLPSGFEVELEETVIKVEVKRL
ncbi:MAG: isoleucine--tRNA ligase [Bacteroidales bacterium]|nr:isoleucine--tRNA ligase [Bacteroidales bacterium]